MKNPIMSLLSISLISLFACKHHPDDIIIKNRSNNNNGNNNGNNNNMPCSPDSVYFNKDILPILNSNCAMSTCHDAGSAQDGVILDNYQNIVNSGSIVPFNPWASEMIESINESDPDDLMPPSPKIPLSQQQKDLIFKWIAQGARNNSCNTCDTNTFKFSLNILPIIQSNCTGCHSGTNPSGGILLDNYLNIKNATSGYKLQNSISWNGTIKMPPSNKLEDCKIKIINKWIANGAPND